MRTAPVIRRQSEVVQAFRVVRQPGGVDRLRVFPIDGILAGHWPTEPKASKLSQDNTRGSGQT